MENNELEIINHLLEVEKGASSLIDEAQLEAEKTILDAKTKYNKEYKEKYPNTEVLNSKDIWSIKCDVAFPCATQFELDENDARKLIDNGVIGVFEGANMPCTLEAADLFIKNKVIYSPGKASNAGGVAVSGLEIEQNKKGEKWSFDDVDNRLQGIMSNIFNNIYQTAKELGDEYNLVKGANNYAFKGIADKMLNR